MKNRTGPGSGPEMHCGVNEARFPYLGICCEALKGNACTAIQGYLPLLFGHDAPDRQHDTANRHII